MTFRKRYRWRFGDIDDAGIAYYPTFFHYYHGDTDIPVAPLHLIENPDAAPE